MSCASKYMHVRPGGLASAQGPTQSGPGAPSALAGGAFTQARRLEPTARALGHRGRGAPAVSAVWFLTDALGTPLDPEACPRAEPPKRALC